MLTKKEKQLIINETIQAIKEKYVLTEKTFQLEDNSRHIKQIEFVENAITIAANYFGIDRELFISKKRNKAIYNDHSLPSLRSHVYMVCRNLPEKSISYQVIGLPFGIDHATVLHGKREHEYKCHIHKDFLFDYEKIYNEVERSLAL